MANDMVNLSSASISSVISGDTSGRKAAQPLTEAAESSVLRSQKTPSQAAVSDIKPTPQNETDVTSQADLAKKEEAARKDLEKQAQNLQAVSDIKGWNVSFRVDDDLNKTIIKVVDTDTQKTIRQIPSEELLSISKRIQELRDGEGGGADLAGLLYNSQV